MIVGARCAGSAAAIALARRGRRVVALDGAGFPSDTLSTHLMFPSHWAELERLGARRRVLELEPPLYPRSSLCIPGTELDGAYRPYDGIAVGSCVRRPGLDLALVETAREAGAEVRERTRVVDLVRERGGRVAGVRWKRRDGEEGAIGARLVIGADGRRSTVARLVGAREHHRRPNRRMMAFAYYEDPRPELRDTATQWRAGDDLVTVFPCDGGLAIVLLMPPLSRIGEFKADATAAFEANVARVEPLAERLEGCTRAGKVRLSFSHPAFFRHSQGPGWALTGDAGHFKDPVTAQGIRDAVRFGRLLGEAVAPCLEDPAALDRALAAWESDRDAQCLPMYQWSNLLGNGDAISPIERAAYRWFARRPDGAAELLAIFSRQRDPRRSFSPSRVLRWIAAAARDPEVDNRELAATVRRDLRRELERIVESRRFAGRRAASAARSGSGGHGVVEDLEQPGVGEGVGDDVVAASVASAAASNSGVM